MEWRRIHRLYDRDDSTDGNHCRNGVHGEAAAPHRIGILQEGPHLDAQWAASPHPPEGRGGFPMPPGTLAAQILHGEPRVFVFVCPALACVAFLPCHTALVRTASAVTRLLLLLLIHLLLPSFHRVVFVRTILAVLPGFLRFVVRTILAFLPGFLRFVVRTILAGLPGFLRFVVRTILAFLLGFLRFVVRTILAGLGFQTAGHGPDRAGAGVARARGL
mmetsp:Transcript_80217/g.259942  ORF Transcript_80217/g.259942 Transcript_80217/m.259942 type:complete len:218 (-) Transcript_80217:598-1251(-)